MVLLEAEKCLHPELIVEPALTVYKDSGIYTEEINEIYRRNKKKVSLDKEATEKVSKMSLSG